MPTDPPDQKICDELAGLFVPKGDTATPLPKVDPMARTKCRDEIFGELDLLEKERRYSRQLSSVPQPWFLCSDESLCD